MKSVVITAALVVGSLFVVPSSLAQVGNGLLVIKASGGRGWSVECLMQKEDGEELQQRLVGRGKTATIAVNKIIGGSCSWEASSSRDSLKIEFSDANFPDKCPFVKQELRCVARFAAGTRGEFEF